MMRKKLPFVRWAPSLTDASMPGMGGVELAHELRATRPDLAVIIMSGYTHEISGLDADDPAISTLQKPFTPVDLRMRVRDALARAKR